MSVRSYKPMRSAVVLLSGGMDSAVLLWHLRRELGVRDVHALSFRYGQKHARELAAARRQARAAGALRHVVSDLRFMRRTAACSALVGGGRRVPDLDELTAAERRQPPTYVPNRNMTFLALAAAYAESAGVRDVFYGAHAGDRYGYWDCTPAFVAAMNRAMGLNPRRPVRVHAPWADMTKAEIVRIGARLGVDFAATWSCYRGGRRPCGRCPTCVERRQAFEAAGVADPLAPAQTAVRGGRRHTGGRRR